MKIIRLINILIAFNIGYWGFYFLVNLFYDISKLSALVVYIIIGLFIGVLTTRREGPRHVREWTKLMEKLDKRSKSGYEIIFYRAAAWPLSIIVTVKKFLKNTSPNNE